MNILLILFLVSACNSSRTQREDISPDQSSMTQYNDLTPEEARVIQHKGTEMPFTGALTDNKLEGTYICRQCNSPLYRSADKFDSHCGWPSFDDEIPGAVTRIPDADGRRTEIVCSNCNGHLGHVFIGEHFTDKNTRHCVNSISMQFIPSGESLPAPIIQSETAKSPLQLEVPEGRESVVLGAGCFWCVDAIFQELKGVERLQVGYSGGKIKEPTYKMVCQGNTGHVEVAQIVYDPSVITYEQLLDIFFHVHDPTTLNRQGNDIGEQYRSVIFYQNEAQRSTAEKVLKEKAEEGLWPDPIVTAIEPLTNWYPAEDYHQDYYNNNTQQGYCSAVIGPKVAKFKKKYAALLK